MGSIPADQQRDKKKNNAQVNPSNNRPIRASDKQYRLFKLSNNIGDNNCFLNVIIQNFYHLEAFRETLKRVIRWKKPRQFNLGQGVNQVFEQLCILCNQILDAEDESFITVDIFKQHIFSAMNNSSNSRSQDESFGPQMNLKADATECF